MNTESLTYKDATHKLSCAHQINPSNRNEYHMLCVILKELPNNRAKILVFGDRRIKIELCGDKKRIRYVSKDRLVKIKEGPTKEDIIGVNHPAELGEI